METEKKSVTRNALKDFISSQGFTSFVAKMKKLFGVVKEKTGSWASGTFSAIKRLFKEKTANSKLVCANCGHKLSSSEKFCSACGTKVPPQETATAAESMENMRPAEPVVPKLGSNVKIKIRKKESVVSASSSMVDKTSPAPETTPDPAPAAELAPTPAAEPDPAPAAEPAPAPAPEPAPAPAPEPAPAPAPEPAPAPAPEPAPAPAPVPPSDQQPTDTRSRRRGWLLRKVQSGNPGTAVNTGIVASLKENEDESSDRLCFWGFGVGVTLAGAILAWCIWRLAVSCIDDSAFLFYLPAIILIVGAIVEGVQLCSIAAATISNGWRGAVKALQGWLIVMLGFFIFYIYRGANAHHQIQSLEREMKKEARKFERELNKEMDTETRRSKREWDNDFHDEDDGFRKRNWRSRRQRESLLDDEW